MGGALNHWRRSDADQLKALLRARYQAAAELVEGVVLDYACGYGLGATMLADSDRVTWVRGMDLDLEAIHEGRKHIAGTRVSLAVGDIEAAPMPAADWLVCCETLEHLHDPWRFLAKAQAKMRRGIVVSIPIEPTVGRGNREHRHDFTEAQLTSRFAPPAQPEGAWARAATHYLEEKARPAPGDLVERVLMRYLVVGFRRTDSGGPR